VAQVVKLNRSVELGAMSSHPTSISPDEFSVLSNGKRWPLTDGNCLADFCCTFQAPKRVVIGRPQGRLAGCAGLMYWSLFIMIFIVYLCWSSIIVSNNHLKYEAPMGSPRISLRRPTQFRHDLGHRCSPQNQSCDNNFTDVTTLLYCDRCTESPQCDTNSTKLPCRLWDEDSVVARNLGKDLVFATHIKEWMQTRVCEGLETHHTCPRTFHSEERARYYLADIENFVLTISHSMRTPAIITEVDMKMHGEGLHACPHPPKHTSPREAEEAVQADPDDDDENEHELHSNRRLQSYSETDATTHAPRTTTPATTVAAATTARSTTTAVQAEASSAMSESDGDDGHNGDSGSHGDGGSRGDGGSQGDGGSHGDGDSHADDNWASSRLRRHMNSVHDALKKATEVPACNHIMPNPELATVSDTHADSFLLGDVLRAAGIDLDESSPAQDSDLDQIRRNRGTSLILTIHYANTKPYKSFWKAYLGDMPIRYHYTLVEMPVREYKLRDSFWTGEWNGQHRTVVEVHGIHLQVMFSGELGTWSWAQFMVLLSVSMTTVFMAEKMVVLFIRFAPLPASLGSSGGVTQQMLADNLTESYKFIDNSWDTVKNNSLSEAKKVLGRPVGPAE